MNKIRLTTEDVAFICRGLAHLLQAGVSPGDGLTLLAGDETQPQWRELFLRMARVCDEGGSLAAAFREAGCFPAYALALLCVGERVGQPAQVLESLAEYYEDRAKMNRQLQVSLTYPGLLLAVLLAVVMILFVWVLPVFDDVYAQLGGGLTGFAGGLLAFGDILRRCLPWLCLPVIGALCAAMIPPVRKAFLGRLSSCWGRGGVGAGINAARYMQALSLGVSSGMTDRESAELAAGLAAGGVFEEQCCQVLTLLDSGVILPRALLQAGVITAGNCRLLEIGRRCGRNEDVLRSLARQMQEEAEEKLERAVGKIEPAMIALACALIGGVLLTVMLPLVQIMNAIG